jgi:hypothetical protein
MSVAVPIFSAGLMTFVLTPLRFALLPRPD